jgi:3-oxoacyl-[acyl-carrier protein] reductase
MIASAGHNGLSVYGTTKAAATDFTRSLAREVGKPGITARHSLSEEGRKRIVGHSALCRLAEANDIASMVEYLLGEGGRNKWAPSRRWMPGTASDPAVSAIFRVGTLRFA